MSASRELKRQVRRYEPCLPKPAKVPPAGPGWIHEIKHDGFRILAELDAGSVKLITRKGFDLAPTLPASSRRHRRACRRARASLTASRLPVDDNGLSVFDLLRYRRQDDAVTLCAFDLLELDGVDLRREPIEVRKSTLKGLLRREHRGDRFQPALRHGGGDHLPERLRSRLRGHCVEAARLAIPARAAGLLGQGQKPGCAGGET